MIRPEWGLEISVDCTCRSGLYAYFEVFILEWVDCISVSRSRGTNSYRSTMVAIAAGSSVKVTLYLRVE